MAKQTEKSSLFNVVAGLLALCLIVVAALTYWQSGNKVQATPELAALSQAIPLQAANALNGTDGAFDRLDNSVRKVAALRRGGAPGRASDWQQLESRAAAIVAKSICRGGGAARARGRWKAMRQLFCNCRRNCSSVPVQPPLSRSSSSARSVFGRRPPHCRKRVMQRR